MDKNMKYDVAVIGGGAAGISAAIAAAKRGARVVLIESSSVIGGDLLSGLPIDGCVSAAGEWIVGGILSELLSECDKLDGYVGTIYDRRNIYVVMVNHDIMGFCILKKLAEYGVDVLPYSSVDMVEGREGTVECVIAKNKGGNYRISAHTYIDCTGDGDIAERLGVPYEMGAHDGELQPMTMVFHMRGVDPVRLLQFVVDHPENCGLGENPNIKKSAKELAIELYEIGQPKVFFSSNGPLMRGGIERGELTSSMLAFNSNSKDGTVVTVNTTRISKKDCLSADSLGGAMLELTGQVSDAFNFIKKNIPGCENVVFGGVAPRLGIRESRRILGEYYLTGEAASNGARSENDVCLGGHEIDIHGSGTNHVRKTIKDGGAYGIPFGCLVPRGMNNLLMAGRCLSADRVAHSSARVMGTCIAMGEAVGTAAAIAAKEGFLAKDIDVSRLRHELKLGGAIVD